MEVEEGSGASQGCPFPAEGREVRGPPSPAGQHFSLQAGPHSWTWIVPEMEFQWQLSASSLPALQLSESRSCLSLPTSLVSQKPRICLHIILALSLGQNLSSCTRPASSEAHTRWGAVTQQSW